MSHEDLGASVAAVSGLEEFGRKVVELDVEDDSGGVPDLADHREADLAGSVEDAVVGGVGRSAFAGVARFDLARGRAAVAVDVVSIVALSDVSLAVAADFVAQRISLAEKEVSVASFAGVAVRALQAAIGARETLLLLGVEVGAD